MEEIDLTKPGSDFIPESANTIDIPHTSENLYCILQQEVELGAQALKRENADMAVTLFQSALQKLTPERNRRRHVLPISGKVEAL